MADDKDNDKLHSGVEMDLSATREAMIKRNKELIESAKATVNAEKKVEKELEKVKEVAENSPDNKKMKEFKASVDDVAKSVEHLNEEIEKNNKNQSSSSGFGQGSISYDMSSKIMNKFNMESKSTEQASEHLEKASESYNKASDNLQKSAKRAEIIKSRLKEFVQSGGRTKDFVNTSDMLFKTEKQRQAYLAKIQSQVNKNKSSKKAKDEIKDTEDAIKVEKEKIEVEQQSAKETVKATEEKVESKKKEVRAEELYAVKVKEAMRNRGSFDKALKKVRSDLGKELSDEVVLTEKQMRTLEDTLKKTQHVNQRSYKEIMTVTGNDKKIFTEIVKQGEGYVKNTLEFTKQLEPDESEEGKFHAMWIFSKKETQEMTDNIGLFNVEISKLKQQIKEIDTTDANGVTNWDERVTKLKEIQGYATALKDKFKDAEDIPQGEKEKITNLIANIKSEVSRSQKAVSDSDYRKQADALALIQKNYTMINTQGQTRIDQIKQQIAETNKYLQSANVDVNLQNKAGHLLSSMNKDVTATENQMKKSSEQTYDTALQKLEQEYALNKKVGKERLTDLASYQERLKNWQGNPLMSKSAMSRSISLSARLGKDVESTNYNNQADALTNIYNKYKQINSEGQIRMAELRAILTETKKYTETEDLDVNLKKKALQFQSELRKEVSKTYQGSVKKVNDERLKEINNIQKEYKWNVQIGQQRKTALTKMQEEITAWKNRANISQKAMNIANNLYSQLGNEIKRIDYKKQSDDLSLIHKDYKSINTVGLDRIKQIDTIISRTKAYMGVSGQDAKLQQQASDLLATANKDRASTERVLVEEKKKSTQQEVVDIKNKYNMEALVGKQRLISLESLQKEIQAWQLSADKRSKAYTISTTLYKEIQRDIDRTNKKLDEENKRLNKGTSDIKLRNKEMKIFLNTVNSQLNADTKSWFASNGSFMGSGDARASMMDKLKNSFIYTTAYYMYNNLINAGRELVQTNQQYEQGLIDLSRTLSNVTNEGLKSYGKQAIEFSKQFGVPLQEVQNAMTELARAGVDNEQDLKDLTKNVLLGLNTTEISNATEMTSYLISAIKQLGLTFQDSGKLIDSWNKLADKYAVKSNDFAEAISRSGSASKSLGIDLDHLNAMVVLLGERTQASGDEIGNALKAMESTLLRPETVETLEDAGIQVMKDAEHFRTFNEIMSDVNVKITSLGEYSKEATDILNALGGSWRRNWVQILSENWGELENIAKESSNALGYSEKENEKAMTTYVKQVEIFSNTLRELYISLGQDGGLMSQLSGIVGNMTDFVNWMNKSSDSTKHFVRILAELSFGTFILSKFSSLVTGKGLKDWGDVIGRSMGLGSAQTRAFDSAIKSLTKSVAEGNMTGEQSAEVLKEVAKSLNISQSSVDLLKAAQIGLDARLKQGLITQKDYDSEMANLQNLYKMANIKQESFKESQKAINASNISLTKSSMALSAVISGIVILISVVGTKVAEYITKQRNLNKVLRENLQNIQNESTKYEDLIDEYESLGKKTSMTADEKKRYLEVTEELVAVLPNATNIIYSENIALEEQAKQLRKVNAELELTKTRKLFEDEVGNEYYNTTTQLEKVTSDLQKAQEKRMQIIKKEGEYYEVEMQRLKDFYKGIYESEDYYNYTNYDMGFSEESIYEMMLKNANSEYYKLTEKAEKLKQDMTSMNAITDQFVDTLIKANGMSENEANYFRDMVGDIKENIGETGNLSQEISVLTNKYDALKSTAPYKELIGYVDKFTETTMYSEDEMQKMIDTLNSLKQSNASFIESNVYGKDFERIIDYYINMIQKLPASQKRLIADIIAMNEVVNGSIEAMDKLASAYNTIDDGGQLQIDQLLELIDLYPDIRDAILESADAELTRGDVIKKVFNMQKDIAIKELETDSEVFSNRRKLLEKDLDAQKKRVIFLTDLLELYGRAGVITELVTAQGDLSQLEDTLAKYQDNIDDIQAKIKAISHLTPENYAGSSGKEKDEYDNSAFEEFMESLENSENLYTYMQDLNQLQEQYAEMTDDVNAVVKLKSEEAGIIEKLTRTYKDNSAKVKEQIAYYEEQLRTTDKNSDAYNAIKDNISTLNDKLEEYTKTIIQNEGALIDLKSSLNDYLDSLRDKGIEVENLIMQALQERDERLKESLENEKEILEESIQAQYEADKKKIESKKDALNKEKEILNERYEAYKNAQDKIEREDELLALQERYNQLSLDNSGMYEKEKLDLKEQITDLQKEMLEQQQEDEIKSQEDIIDAKLEAFDKEEEELENHFEHMEESWSQYYNSRLSEIKNVELPALEKVSQDYWLEYENIMKMSQDEIVNFLKNNLNDYRDAGKLQRDAYLEGWGEIFDVARKIYNGEINLNQIVNPIEPESSVYETPSSPAPSPVVQPDYRSYTVQSGDTLSGIAYRELGSASRWREIFDLNRDRINDPNFIRTGWVLKLPEYLLGGLNTEAGLALLHGTKQNPERILSSQQTKSFDRLVDTLDSLPQFKVNLPYSNGLSGIGNQVMNNITSGDFIIKHLEVRVDTLNDDADYKEVAKKVGNEIYKMVRGSGQTFTVQRK